MGADSTAATLTPAQAEFIQNGVSVIVASAGAAGEPSQARGVGCVVAPGRDRIVAYLRRSQCGALLDDIGRSGRVAVTFCLPSTHRTLQIKGTEAQVRAAQDPDLAELARQIAAFHAQLAGFGYTASWTQAALGFEPADLVEVVFAPQAVFSQTPGPRAGERVS